MSPRAAATPETPETPEKRALRVERIKQLIQQASSPHGDGQQAAYRACALIRKFGLDVVDPALVDDLHKTIHQLRVELSAAKTGDVDVSFGMPGPQTHGGGMHANSSWQTSMRSHSTRPSPSGFGGSVHVPWTAPPPPRATPPPPPQPVQPPPAAAKSPMAGPMLIKAKFNGRCIQCKTPYSIDDPIQWQKHVGAWCPTSSCYNDWFNNQQSAANFNPFGP